MIAKLRRLTGQLETQNGMGVRGKAQRQRLRTHVQEALVEDRKMQDIPATSGSQPMCCEHSGVLKKSCVDVLLNFDQHLKFMLTTAKSKNCSSNIYQVDR